MNGGKAVAGGNLGVHDRVDRFAIAFERALKLLDDDRGVSGCSLLDAEAANLPRQAHGRY